MNNGHALTPENLLAALPQALRGDRSISALAAAAAEVLAARAEEIDRLRIYSRIDGLPEDLLDILAYDFKVDWWDYGYTIEQKRQTLKDSFLVHKRLGTKFAVETALSAIYPRTKVQEWFEYGGAPYTFRLLINVSGRQVDLDRHTRVLKLANYYKNLRSHLGEIEYTIQAKRPAALRYGGRIGAVIQFGIPELPDDINFSRTMRLGGQVSAAATIPVPAVPDDIRFVQSARAGGQMGSVSAIRLPPVSDAVEFMQIGRLGGHVANITTITMPEPRE